MGNARWGLSALVFLFGLAVGAVSTGLVLQGAGGQILQISSEKPPVAKPRATDSLEGVEPGEAEPGTEPEESEPVNGRGSSGDRKKEGNEIAQPRAAEGEAEPDWDSVLKILDSRKFDEVFKSVDDDEFLGFVHKMREKVDDRFLVPDPDIVSRYAHLAGKLESGVNRILERGELEGLTVGRGGGAYFSFETRENDYDKGPDLALEQTSFSSGFAGGDDGVVIAVDDKTIDDITLNDVPDFLLTEDAEALCNSRQSHRYPKAELFQTYLIRSVRWDESDLLAAFQVVQKDKRGVTFAWKILKRFPVPKDE